VSPGHRNATVYLSRTANMFKVEKERINNITYTRQNYDFYGLLFIEENGTMFTDSERLQFAAASIDPCSI
jgi:hypothetical protein